jgi:diguanylate cyclase (GGDEF)-like protein
MFKHSEALPRAAWANIIRWTLVVTVASAAISVAVAQTIMLTLSQGLNAAGVAASIVLPVLLGTPMIFYHLLRLQQLRLANRQLHVLASTDWLTTCLNRRAFTHQVTDQLTVTRKGAFLVIDADHFKIINDRFGHDRGDEVLQAIAETIKANVREGDLVGRIGGEEFGVFLMGATFETARRVAERIRHAIVGVKFAPEGDDHPLSVSVGGAFFEGSISFTELFRIADQRLYGAKQMGRNHVEVAHAADYTLLPDAAAAFTSAAA